MEYIHPKDHNKIAKKLPTIGVVFLFVIIVGFITTKEPEHKYVISITEMQAAVLDQKESLSPEESIKILYSHSPEYRFIDLRNPHDYINGHIEGAVNIPLQNLLSEEYASLLEDESITNILYAYSQSQACGPWMLLKQLGYNNNRIMLGGYNFIKNNVMDNFTLRSNNYQDELAKYDYAKVVKETSGGLNVGSKSKAKKALPVARKKKKKAAAGGCS
ncbi:rhodanese-like domain-containing protein [Candidatus Venteria ishoeyi]|uniref:Thiosulfate:cyanide sulfurtransferase n=1 Tax=Candidatus Venteria ishoeyi TaxID=1899563 RepID=A0A1H6F7C0_9GAMM|nr:rhodanese-like domain-containing protein [Candidatus Venteria ishoeyi]SEH05433.1 thiosulfate:cyanide sulfurtransferase [Candidatus Venteria ishoeyi]